MNRLDAAIDDIRDPKLRATIAEEVRKLRTDKKFGLVFEEHLPELTPIFTAPVLKGAVVARKAGPLRETFRVVSVQGETARCRAEADGTEQEFALEQLVVIKAFGEAIFPALTSLESVRNGGDRPSHLLIEADNYHALQLLEYLYRGRVDVIYIDPPYNTGARDWKYNNDYVDSNDSFRHSKWLSFMKRRLRLAKRLLKPDGVLIATIDDNEAANLYHILAQVFPERAITTVCIKYNRSGTKRNGLYRVHEYAYFVTEPGQELEKRPAPPLVMARNLRRNGNNSARGRRPTMFYPIYVDKETLTLIGVGEQPAEDFHPASHTMEHDDRYEIWPIDDEGTERRWYYSADRVRTRGNDELEFRWVKGRLNPYFQTSNGNETRYNTLWVGSEFDSGLHGTNLVKAILGRDFPFPKSVYAVKECLATVIRRNRSALVVDFFAGSGTTLSAVDLLNVDDGGNRQCILVTNNEVSGDEGDTLSQMGIHFGHPHWEQHGICRSVTFPRCKATILGRRDDGTALSGEFVTGLRVQREVARNVRSLGFTSPDLVQSLSAKQQLATVLGIPPSKVSADQAWFCDDKSEAAVLFDPTELDPFCEALAETGAQVKSVYLVMPPGSAFSKAKLQVQQSLGPLIEEVEIKRPLEQGFESNLEYFKLDFLDPVSVEYGQNFPAVLPMLWMIAGARGPVPSATGKEPFLFPDGCPFTVLLDDVSYREFRAELRRRSGIEFVFLVTDAEDAFFAMQEDLGVKCLHLYRHYLLNFQINEGDR